MTRDPREEAREKARQELDAFFRRKIAEKDQISEEEVTVEYIRKERERRYYPNLRYEIGSNYGGYSGVGLHFSTGREIQERQVKMEADILEEEAS